jgi:hypothetical protein
VERARTGKMERDRTVPVHRELKDQKGKNGKGQKQKRQEGKGGKGLEGRVEIDMKEEWTGKGKRTDKNRNEERKGTGRKRVNGQE